jgi:uncharacterized protein
MNQDKIFEKADRLYDRGQFKKAFDIFLELAQRGDASACSRVANMYGDGKGVAFDFAKSVEWDLRAIELGNMGSLFNLGVSYRTRGDSKEARKWFEKSLEAGDGEAAVELAKLLHVSEHESDRVFHLLKFAIESKNITDGSREEAQELLREISR